MADNSKRSWYPSLKVRHAVHGLYAAASLVVIGGGAVLATEKFIAPPPVHTVAPAVESPSVPSVQSADIDDDARSNDPDNDSEMDEACDDAIDDEVSHDPSAQSHELIFVGFSDATLLSQEAHFLVFLYSDKERAARMDTALDYRCAIVLPSPGIVLQPFGMPAARALRVLEERGIKYPHK